MVFGRHCRSTLAVVSAGLDMTSRLGKLPLVTNSAIAGRISRCDLGRTSAGANGASLLGDEDGLGEGKGEDEAAG